MSKEDVEQDYDLNIDLTLFIYEYPLIAKIFFNNSLQFLQSLEQTVLKIQNTIQNEISEESLFRLIVKPKVKLQILLKSILSLILGGN